MFGYIYMTTNLVNNKKYIGKRDWKDETTIKNDVYLGSGKVLKQAISKYGISNFKKDILEICYSEDELIKKEKEYIKLYKATKSNEFYNIHEGGKGGNTREGYTQEELENFKIKMKLMAEKRNYKHSEEVKEKIRISMKSRDNHMKLPKYRKMFSEKFKGKNNPMYGKPMPEHVKQKLLESHNGFFAYNKGKKMSESQKQKISQTMKDAWKNEDNRKKWINAKIGRCNTVETKEKMSESAYKRYGTFPYDENIVIYKCDELWNIIKIYYGINEYYNDFKTKTCRNLKSAVKNKSKFKNFYWYVELKSQSTIENVDNIKSIIE